MGTLKAVCKTAIRGFDSSPRLAARIHAVSQRPRIASATALSPAFSPTSRSAMFIDAIDVRAVSF